MPADSRYEPADQIIGMVEAAMDPETEWRKALQARGRERIRAELETRAGAPDDVVLDVVYEPPYPTREFCQRWCAEQDNRMFHLSGYSKAALIALLLLTTFVIKAVVSWNSLPVNQQSQMQLQAKRPSLNSY